MRVLIACEFSGTVREAFAAKGHDAWSCDLLPSDMPGQHIQGDVLEVLDKKWDLMIAHPPCTYLSNAGARHLFKGKQLNIDRYAQGVLAKDFFMSLWQSNIQYICVENPVPSAIYAMPKYTQIIKPYMFGHPMAKRTCLWLKNLPPLVPTNMLDTWESTKVAGNWYNKGGKYRWKQRSKTFQGIADAMADQWGGQIMPEQTLLDKKLTYHQFCDLMTDAWMQTESETGYYPNSGWRRRMFTILEQKVQEYKSNA